MHERELSADQVIASLRPKMAQIPGLRVSLVNQPPINVGGRGSRSLYQFTLQDTDTESLYHWAPIFEAKMRELPGLQDVSSDLQLRTPQVSLDFDRDRISSLGLTANQVENALYNAFGTRQVSQIFAPNNQYQVVMQVAPEFQRDPKQALSMLYVRSSSGRLVPLDTIAAVQDQRRSALGEPHRAAAVGDPVVQPRARLLARRRRRRGAGRRRPQRCRRR